MLTADAPWPANPSSGVTVDWPCQSQFGSPADCLMSAGPSFSRASSPSGKMLMPASVEYGQAPQPRSTTRSRWVHVQCLQCNETAVLKLQWRDSPASLHGTLTCRRCGAGAPRIEPSDPPPFLSGANTPALLCAGAAAGAAIAYFAMLFANAVDYQAVQNARLSPKGGYYERMEPRPDLPQALR
jgi:hypothetical protein